MIFIKQIDKRDRSSWRHDQENKNQNNNNKKKKTDKDNVT